MTFETTFFLLSLIAGAVASLSGFGIGSILTPALALHEPTKVAVAVVAIPHFLTTLVRFVQMWRRVDRKVFFHFGLLSAAGGLAGSIVHTFVQSRVLAVVLALLLIFAGLSQLFGWMERLRFGSRTAWIAGALSGLFGGMVGNQGGIRSAALLGFGLTRDTFIATATGIALLVDVARMPVYVANELPQIERLWPLVLWSAVGGILGTFAGVRILRRVPEKIYQRTVAGLILLLGVFMLFEG